MSTEKPCHFAHLLQVSKKYLWSVILYIIFHVFIHVYSPGTGADNPLGSEFLHKRKPFVTLVICCRCLPLNDFLTVFPIRDQIWPCRKIGQGQPRVIFWTNYDGPQCYIPSHKVIGPLVLEKNIFEVFLPYMGVAAILVMWPRPHEQTFVPPSHGGYFHSPKPRRLHMKFGFDWPSGFGDLWKCWTDNGRQSMPIL